MKATHYTKLLLVPVLLGTTLAAVVLFLSGAATGKAASPAGPTGWTLYVATSGNDSGNDCLDNASPCASLQHAVEQAFTGDEIRVAAGTYSGAQTITHTDSYTYTQVVLIDKGLTLRGGYSTIDWANSKPSVNSTTIDPAGFGRGITVIGTLDDQVLIEGFTITGGDYTGLGNPAGVPNQVCNNTGGDCGGGIYVQNSAVYLKDLTISFNNAGEASEGGGIYLWQTRNTHIDGVRVLENLAISGGGLHAEDISFPITITDSLFAGNQAELGGGISLQSSIRSLVKISDSEFYQNAATDGRGGGIYARLANNGKLLELDRIYLSENSATEQGMAIHLDAAGAYEPIASLSNLILAGNQRQAGTPTTLEDAVIAVVPIFTSLTVEIDHVTAADNPVDNFLYAEPSYNEGKYLEVALKNTLVSGFTNAFTAYVENNNTITVVHDHTLAYDVDNLHQTLGGTPSFTALNPVGGDPMLNAYFHLSPGSSAIDTGMDAGIDSDIDNNPRPFGNAPDVGADEFTEIKLFLPLLSKD